MALVGDLVEMAEAAGHDEGEDEQPRPELQGHAPPSEYADHCQEIAHSGSQDRPHGRDGSAPLIAPPLP